MERNSRMKKFQFLLLDAGPIIKLFELGIWDEFIKMCDITITRTIANEAKWASRDFEDIRIDIESYENQGLVKIVDLSPSDIKPFFDKFNPAYRTIIHDGEKESLALLNNSKENWFLWSSDGAVFKDLGLIGKSEQGISLQEIFEQIGLSRKLEWQYTREFREKHTRIGQMDSIQDKGLI